MGRALRAASSHGPSHAAAALLPVPLVAAVLPLLPLAPPLAPLLLLLLLPPLPRFA